MPLYGACNADAYDRYGSRLIYVLAGDEKAVARLLDGQGARDKRTRDGDKGGGTPQTTRGPAAGWRQEAFKMARIGKIAVRLIDRQPIQRVKCPYCGSERVEAVKSWDMPKMGYRVTHYRCKNCGGLFNHYVGRGKEFVLRVGPRRPPAGAT